MWSLTLPGLRMILNERVRNDFLLYKAFRADG